MRGLWLVGLLMAAPVLAQEEGFRVTGPLVPPVGAEAQELEAQARRRGIDTGMTYADRIDGDLSDGPAVTLHPQTEEPETALPRAGPVSTIVVLAVLLGALALWLRFGGSGMLLARAPRPDQQQAAAPEAWAISAADRATDPRSLLDQIAVMPDRQAALARLLRHCLLRAGEDSDTRFARADTEREAFRRLPASWRLRAPLGALLGAAELAHYGGRAVDDAGFAAALETGRQILIGGAAHA